MKMSWRELGTFRKGKWRLKGRGRTLPCQRKGFVRTRHYGRDCRICGAKGMEFVVEIVLPSLDDDIRNMPAGELPE